MPLNYSELELKVGLEIHRQLDTQNKLFCQCPTRLAEGDASIKFPRRLRPTQSELGQIDPAALFEFQKDRTIVYEADPKTTCLVEMDEEPPHELNPEAIDVCLTVAMMINAKPLDEIHVMRKIVIDGSNTTGFQRTCIVSTGGEITVGDLRVPINQISLEEDAARKTFEDEKVVHYRIDRLGIPLIEVTTAPVMRTPEDAEKVASAIGRILRSTGKVKRGLGTIRQDLNISIKNGALTEVKGVQSLDLIGKVVESEVQRQVSLLRLRDELKQRGASEEDLKKNFTEVTEVFRGTQSKVIRKALEAKGVVKAVVLRKFAGLLRTELATAVRLGSEMAQRAIFWGGVAGIFHTDEMPAYGITEKEVEQLRSATKAGPQDAVVFVADSPDRAEAALLAVIERAKEALVGVPHETRGPTMEGSTKYMRPRPGAARMYPETDVPPVPITAERMARIRKQLPPLPDEALKAIMEKYSLNKKLAEQLMDSDYLPLFTSLADETKVPTTFIATTLTEVLKSLERKGVPVENLTDRHISETFQIVDSGATAKESVSNVLEWLCNNRASSPKDAIEKLGLRMLTRAEVQVLVEKKIVEQSGLANDKDRGFNKLMNVVMGELRGRADAEMVSEILRSTMEKMASKK